MFNFFKRYINKSDFLKNSLTLITGTTIAQLLPIAVYPILTRLYTPQDFGVLSLFTSIVMIFSIIANGRYELAIVLPKKDSYAINIWALTVVIAGFVSLILLLSILLFHDFFVKILKEKNISFWLYLVPVVVFFISTFNSLNYWFTRKKDYKTISILKITRMGVLSISQVALYLIHNGTAALIGGYGLGQFTGSAGFSLKLFKEKKLLKKINKATMLAMARRYKRFPQFTMFGGLFNRTATELPNIFISNLFNTTTLGFYSLSYRTLFLPITFIGTSISQVYIKEASDEKNRTGSAKKTFINVAKKLFIIGLPIFTIIFFSAKPLFSFVFGKDWAIAGEYAQIITPLAFVKFIVSPLSVTLSVYEKQHISMFLQIGLLIVVLFSFGIIFFLHLPFIKFLYIFVSLLVLYYIFFFFVLYKIATK